MELKGSVSECMGGLGCWRTGRHDSPERGLVGEEDRTGAGQGCRDLNGEPGDADHAILQSSFCH